MTYDLIGDIHGFISPLRDLLIKLSYRQINEYLYEPPKGHQVIFIGDYIDRGEDSVSVLKTVKAMVDANYAIALMGNHEFNAINYHTLKKDHENIEDERYQNIRSHNEKHYKQHKATLDNFTEQEEAIQPWIEWFYTLPLFYETDEFIAIHACPVKQYLDALKEHEDTNNNLLTKEFIYKSATKKSFEDDLIQNLLKGPEYPLPSNLIFHDKDGNVRKEIRLNWWDLNDDNKQIQNWNQLALSVPEEAQQVLAEKALNPDEIKSFRKKVEIPQNKMIFIGHYWKSGTIEKMTDNVICLDYSIGKGGKLVCYSLCCDTDKKKGYFTYSV